MSSSSSRIKSVSYSKYGYIFVAPFFIIYFIFQFYPLIYTFWLSTQEYLNKVDLATGVAISTGPNPVGLQNFSYFVDNKSLLESFKNTFIMWGFNFIPQLGLALLLAEWFTNIRLKIKGMGVFKVLIYLPNVITAASIAVLFTSLFDYPHAPINNLLTSMGIIKQPFEFFRSVGWTRGIVSFIQTWMWYGQTMLVLISGILGINPSLFEAASIDGATSFETFIHITLPEIQPIMLYNLVTSLIGGLQLYDVPKLLNKGNPNGTTRTVNVKIQIVKPVAFLKQNEYKKIGYKETYEDLNGEKIYIPKTADISDIGDFVKAIPAVVNTFNEYGWIHQGSHKESEIYKFVVNEPSDWSFSVDNKKMLNVKSGSSGDTISWANGYSLSEAKAGDTVTVTAKHKQGFEVSYTQIGRASCRERV